MGYRIILTTDRTLMSEYRHIPLLDFLGCAPAERLPEPVFNFFAPLVPALDGVAQRAPYGLRKLEAALLKGYRRDGVMVVHPNHIADFLDRDTKVVGVNTMDPLGLGPVSLMFTGNHFTPYAKKAFTLLLHHINRERARRGLRFKLAVGGPGAWQFECQPDKIQKMGIDTVVRGELDNIAPSIFQEIEDGSAPPLKVIRKTPRVEEIPAIVNPSLHGLVEVMRGCGRNCEFCEPNLRRARYIPVSMVQEEIAVNMRAGLRNAWVHSEDIFLYGLDDKRSFMPNVDAVVELFQGIMSAPELVHANPTHGTIAPAAAAPGLIAKLSEVLKAGPDNWLGIQPGLETGSGRLMHRYMPLKMKPFGPDEWADVVLNGNEVFNRYYWFPAYTLIMGLPGETDEDCWDTLRLLDSMERELPKRVGPRAHFTATPLAFVPVGVLRGEAFEDAGHLTEAQYCVIYRSWRHLMLEANSLPQAIVKLNPGLKAMLNLLMRLGCTHLLSYMRRLGYQLGYDYEKALIVRR